MRIFVAGADGYLGWSLSQHLASRGHLVAGADNGFRRQWVEEMGSWSAIPISPMPERLRAFTEHFGQTLRYYDGDLRDYAFVERIFREFQPEAIVHLGECPSAPYSMIDREHATFAQFNNLASTFNLLFAIRDCCPTAHLVKLGTMGEYGTPGIPIPEGFFEVDYRGHHDRLPFPRQAPSWYHWSKVHGSNNIMFACRVYGLAATDIMQGIVFGTHIDAMGNDPRLATRLDFDQCFGTVVNRYCTQAVIGHPLTPYGQGHQKRGFLPLRDSMQCLTLAVEHPAHPGEYRVFNQFEEVHDILELAQTVQRVGNRLGLAVDVQPIENPRLELEDHYYEVDHRHLLDLGYQPTHDVETEVESMLRDLIPHHERISAKSQVLIPDIRWQGRRERSHAL